MEQATLAPLTSCEEMKALKPNQFFCLETNSKNDHVKCSIAEEPRTPSIQGDFAYWKTRHTKLSLELDKIDICQVPSDDGSFTIRMIMLVLKHLRDWKSSSLKHRCQTYMNYLRNPMAAHLTEIATYLSTVVYHLLNRKLLLEKNTDRLTILDTLDSISSQLNHHESNLTTIRVLKSTETQLSFREEKALRQLLPESCVVIIDRFSCNETIYTRCIYLGNMDEAKQQLYDLQARAFSSKESSSTPPPLIDVTDINELFHLKPDSKDSSPKKRARLGDI